MDDGVQIAATFYRPDGQPPAGGWPSVMLFHGLGASRGAPYIQNSVEEIAETYFAPQGYAVLAFDARGHGESGGVSSLDGPREIQDVRTLFGWLTSQPAIDPAHVGALGISLGAGAILRATADGVPFAAIVPVIGWSDLYQALFPQGLSKSGAVASFFSLLPPDRWAPDVRALLVDALRSDNTPAVRRFADERSALRELDRIKVPVFLIQGRRDFAFDIGQARVVFNRLHTAKRLYIGDLGHPPAPNPAAERPHYLAEARAWFDRWLKGEPNGIDKRPRVEVAPDPWTGKTFQYKGLPPTRTLSFTLAGRRTMTAQGKIVRTIRLPRRKLEAFGAATVSLSASTPTSWPHLVAVLTALMPGGQEFVVSEGGIRVPSGRRRFTVRFRLVEDACFIPAGSRLQLTFAASSTAQSVNNALYLDIGTPPDAAFTVRRVKLALPVLRKPISG
jgi:predicted acyl esterase